MQLTDLGPIDGFALNRLHARLSIVDADLAAREALVAAARRLSSDGTVMLILGADEATEVAAAIDHRRMAAAASRLRSTEGAVAATASRIGEQASSVVDGRARLAEFEEHLLWLTRASAEVEVARAAHRAAVDDARRAGAAVALVLAQRAEVDEAVRHAGDRLSAGDADDELLAQVAEVQRVLDETEAERRAGAMDADVTMTVAESRLRRAEDEMRDVHQRIAGPDPVDAERFLEERGECLRSAVVAAERACDRAEEAHRAALAARDDAARQAQGPEARRAGPADVVRSLRTVGALEGQGPIPILFDEPFEFDGPASLGAVTAELDELSDHTQVLYLTAEPGLLAWAATLPPASGARVAACTRRAVHHDPTGLEPTHT